MLALQGALLLSALATFEWVASHYLPAKRRTFLEIGFRWIFSCQKENLPGAGFRCFFFFSEALSDDFVLPRPVLWPALN